MHRSYNYLFCLPGLPVGPILDDTYPGIRQCGARFALLLLSGINLINFADRYIPSAVKPLYQEDLGLSDFQSSLPATGMIVVFMVAAMIFGTLADKQLVDRRFMLCAAIIFWSAATSLAGLATNLVQLVALRSLVGVGEAAYGTVAPPMLSDFYPDKERNAVYGLYYLAVPVGAAIGYGVGAVLGAVWGWRAAFLACGVPGLFLAAITLQLANPVRGINDRYRHFATMSAVDSDCNMTRDIVSPLHSCDDSADTTNQEQTRRKEEVDRGDTDRPLESIPGSTSQSEVNQSLLERGVYSENSRVSSGTSNGEYKERHYDMSVERISNTSGGQSWSKAALLLILDLKVLFTNGPFVCATLGLTASNFALGGMADWYGSFLVRYSGAGVASAGLVLGAITVIGGIAGTVLGSKTADWARPKVRNAYFLVPALFTLVGAALLFLALNLPRPLGLNISLILLAEICVWTYTAPVSALSMSSVPPRLRARSAGVQILVQHMLGDVISPPIIGGLSDTLGSLQQAMQITWAMLALGGLIWLGGYYILSPLPTGNGSKPNTHAHQGCDEQRELRDASNEAGGVDIPVTYSSLLCGADPLVVDARGNVVLRGRERVL